MGTFQHMWGREQDPQLEDALKVQYLNDDWEHGGLFIAEANDNPQNDDVTIDVHRLRVRRRLALCRWLNSAISTCPSIKVGEKLVENTGGRGGILGSTVTAFSILNELTKLNIATATKATSQKLRINGHFLAPALLQRL